MSTRSTIWYQDSLPDNDLLDMHLYSEMLEDGALYLEITDGPFLCTVKLPQGLIKAIKGTR